MEPTKRELTITCDSSELLSKEAHNYSIQSLNTTEMAKKKLRNCLSEVVFMFYLLNCKCRIFIGFDVK